MEDRIMLDDGIEYYVIKEEKINGITYTLFANVNDNTDICFRKTVILDNNEYYVGLDNDTEFDLVMMHFAKDILKEIEN